MSAKLGEHTGIEWQKADVRDMDNIASQSVDIAFDKGTMDAMIHGSPWSPPEEVLNNTGCYMNEVVSWGCLVGDLTDHTKGLSCAQRLWCLFVRHLQTATFRKTSA